MTADVLRALLVEDQPGDARLVVEALRDTPDAAIELECVETLASALDRVRRGDIELLLLDLGLPDSIGLATLERFHAAFPTIPVVALTGLDDPETALSAVQSGAQDYLVKGQLDGALLARTARYAVERHRLSSRVERLHEETVRRLRRLSSLRAIDLAIAAGFDIHITLGLILDYVIAELDVEAASVLLLDPGSHQLDFAQGRGSTDLATHFSAIGRGESGAERVVSERRVVSMPVPTAARSAGGRTVPDGGASYVGAPLATKGQVKGVLQALYRAPIEPDAEWLEFFETLAGQAAIAVDNFRLFEGLQQSNRELSLAYDSTLEGWSRALDLRDKETEGHSRRVTEATVLLARSMGLRESEVVNARRGALLHDIGKMGIPDRILLKAGPLTEEEWEVMRRHPTYARDLLWPIAYLRPALDIPHFHHEKWDGTGYPHGLKGEEIPFAARLFAVADVWDALSSDRPYRRAWEPEKVRAHLDEQAGKHFDPSVVAVFKALDESLKILRAGSGSC